jgi:hypothetical protein
VLELPEQSTCLLSIWSAMPPTVAGSICVTAP